MIQLQSILNHNRIRVYVQLQAIPTETTTGPEYTVSINSGALQGSDYPTVVS
jgi:hypothetical protein